MLVHWIWLATRQGLNERIKYELLEHFHDPEAVYRDTGAGYAEIRGITKKAVEALLDKSLEEARKILTHCNRTNIHLLTYQDEAYPARLRNIYDPPILLYYRGNLPRLEELPVIGAVGTRTCSSYGIDAGRQLGYQLSTCGALVASGMAEGIDTAVLTGALAAKGTVTVFLAGGVDVIYPRENRWLYELVLHQGCILSEYPPGTKPLKWNFPVRNRLISGVSNGVLVVEAPEKSGALITARHAMEQGRDVFAVPGTIHAETGKGSNALLRDGAMMAQSGWDILETYQHLYPDRLKCRQDCPEPEFMEQMARKLSQRTGSTGKNPVSHEIKDKKTIDNSVKPPYIDVEKKPAERTAQEQAVIAQLLEGPKLTDQVIIASGLSYGEALAAVTVLEISGTIRRLPGNMLALNET